MTEKRPKLDKLVMLHCTQHRLLACEEFIRLYTMSHTSTPMIPAHLTVRTASPQRLGRPGVTTFLWRRILQTSRDKISAKHSEVAASHIADY